MFIFNWRTPIICDLSLFSSEKLKPSSLYSLKGLIIRFASLVTGPTQNALSTIQKTLKLQPNKVSLVVNGADSSPLFESEKIDIIRGKLKLSKNKTIIVVHDSLEKPEELKGLQKVIHACKAMHDDIHFLVIGSPKEHLYTFLKKYHLRNMCTLITDASKKLLPQYYAVSDIALSLSCLHQDEGRLKLLNFMASELPVVAYDGKNQQEYLTDDTVLSHSLKEIISNLKDLHHNQAWQKRLGTINLDRFDEFYSWEVSKEQLYASYAQVLD